MTLSPNLDNLLQRLTQSRGQQLQKVVHAASWIWLQQRCKTHLTWCADPSHPLLPVKTVLPQGGQRGAGPVQGLVPPQQAVPVGAGQAQGLQGGSQALQGAMAPQAGDSHGPGRAFLEQRQGAHQPLQPQPVTMQLAGQGRGVAERHDGGLGSSGHAGRQAPGQVSGAAPGCLATARVLRLCQASA